MFTTVSVGTGHTLANVALSLEATSYTFTATISGQTPVSYTDSANVSQLGAAYRDGMFGTDEASLPGTIAAWNFYDSGPTTGPATAYVATAETSTGGTYADLTTTTDQVTVTIGPSLLAIVSMDCAMSGSVASLQGFMGAAFSGANTVAATDDLCVQYETSASSKQGAGICRVVKFTNQGATTGKLKYRTSTGGTVTFSNRSISIIPL